MNHKNVLVPVPSSQLNDHSSRPFFTSKIKEMLNPSRNIKNMIDKNEIIGMY